MLVRSAERAPYSAPQTASASADISVLMNVVSICRSRSGLAWASCSCRKWAGSILLGAVIASNSWGCGRYPEDHAVAASTWKARWSPGPSHTTLVDATRVSPAPFEGRRSTARPMRAKQRKNGVMKVDPQDSVRKATHRDRGVAVDLLVEAFADDPLF